VKPLKSEKHHWWPRCVSIHWRGDDGTVARIDPTGRTVRSSPEKFGVIRNAHHIKLGHKAEGPSPWDSSFEKEFDRADGGFPALIDWLARLHQDGDSTYGRFTEHAATDDQLAALTESVVSLVVRSPRSREGFVGVAERLRGPLPSKERNALISLNMHRKQRMVSDSIGNRAKFAVLFSRDREFIFGDGFFHNLQGVVDTPSSPKILVPLTPSMAVAITRPWRFLTHPRLVSIVLHPLEVDAVNLSVQAYAKSELFFRSEQPELDYAFRTGKHLQYSHPDNPIDTFLRSIPGIPDRDRRLDALFSAKA
jgi:hypothetical protein